MRLRVAVGVLSAVLVLSSFARVARAESPPQDCPPGSIGRATGAFSWCEPTICQTDLQCGTGQVCRAVPLCVQIGSVKDDAGGARLAPGSDAQADRLVVTAPCVGGSCPSDSVCSTHPRCIDRAIAQRMGILTAAAPSASADPTLGGTAETTSSGGKKCGCDVVGRGDARTTSGVGGLAAVVVVAAGRRRRTGRNGRSGRSGIEER